MSDNIEWRSLDVTAAEGMSLRVGSFRASDGEVVEFTPDVLKKVFSKVTDPVPMYLTHKDAGTGQPRTVLGHAVKLGLEMEGDKVHFKALMMDPTFKLMYASGYDDTSAEITPIRDDTGRIIDGTLTGIAVVPNPAISGTEMKVSAVAFSAPTKEDVKMEAVKPNSGGIRLTGRTIIERTLLESGVAADKLDATVEALGVAFSKKFEHDGIEKKFSEAQEQLKLACSERDEMKKKFEDLTKEYDGMLNEKVTALANEIKTVGFANPEAVVEGLTVQQKIATLSKMKENLATTKPMNEGPKFESPMPPAPGTTEAFDKSLAELGVSELWAQYHKGA